MPEPKSTDASQSKFRILVNEEDQYSIWPMESTIPPGWNPVRDVGIEATGLKEDCLKRIGELWTDMRPRSLRTVTSSR